MAEINLRIAGQAGQGMLSAGRFLSGSCIRAGYFVYGERFKDEGIFKGVNMFQRIIMGVATGLSVLLLATSSFGQSSDPSDAVIFGFKLRVGGRFDNVRMCVASPAGVKGGPAMDISFFTEFPATDDMTVSIDVPVMRPILFAASFNMLQFEPEVTLKFKKVSDGKVDFVAGPTMGITFHYGPDFNSERSGDGRGPSFFALGPRVGAFVGMDIKRPGETFNFQLGLSPYVSPLFSGSENGRSGIVAGGSLDGLFRFSTR